MTLRSLAGGRVFADVSSSDGGRETVFLHGWGRDRHDFAEVVDRVPGRTVAMDLPGFGTSPPPPEAWGAADYAALVADALDELDAKGAAGATAPGVPVSRVLVGHSFGGRVATALAAGRPELASGLVLAGVPLLRRQGGGARPAPAFRLGRALHRRGLIPEARMESLRQRYGSADYRAATGVMRAVLVRVVAESYEDELGRLRCPLEMVWGDHDTAAPVAVAHRAAGLVVGSHLEVIDGVGHDVHHERPDAVASAVERVHEAAKR